MTHKRLLTLTKIKEAAAELLRRCGLSANMATAIGLALAAASGATVIEGRFQLAGWLLLASGFFDLMDGAIARASGRVTPFGGILDSSLDRYGDGLVLGGLTIYCATTGRSPMALLGLSAILGSFAVSYVRARVECVVPSCRTGYWERGERIVLIALGFLADNPGTMLLILGIGVHFTVVARLRLAHALVNRRPDPSRGWLRRDKPAYLWACAALAAVTVWVRVPF
ncbi:MAG: hypothetical protein MOGMAGMI_01404 [Candidatus Omnitrophica bacterium]|nr:hypothetical protein [Candidatus Omnitrophota bacterium]